MYNYKYIYFIYKFCNFIYIIWYKRNKFIEVTGFFFFIFLKNKILIVYSEAQRNIIYISRNLTI